MLPPPTDPGFPAALKAAREARGFSRSEFARRAKVHSVMPGRYESQPGAPGFTRPTQKTWNYLNAALGFGPMPVSPPPGVPPVPAQLIEDAVARLTAAGVTVTLVFPPGWRAAAV